MFRMKALSAVLHLWHVCNGMHTITAVLGQASHKIEAIEFAAEL